MGFLGAAPGGLASLHGGVHLSETLSRSLKPLLRMTDTEINKSGVSREAVHQDLPSFARVCTSRRDCSASGPWSKPADSGVKKDSCGWAVSAKQFPDQKSHPGCDGERAEW